MDLSFFKHFLVLLSVGLGFKTKILSDSKLVLYFKTALRFTRSCIYWSAFLNLEVSAAAPSALSLISASQAAGPRSKCLGQSGPCGMFSIRVSDDYSPAISKKQSELVLDELRSGVDQCGARICGSMFGYWMMLRSPANLGQLQKAPFRLSASMSLPALSEAEGATQIDPKCLDGMLVHVGSFRF